MKFKPYEYQERMVNEVIDKFNSNERLLMQSPTGSGKTVIFSYLCSKWVNLHKGKILILCHRTELIDQTAKTLIKFDLTYEKITASTKRMHNSSDVYIAMVETLDRRLKKNPYYLKHVSLVIADECHVQTHNKIFDYFTNTKILGVTATPTILGKDVYFRCDRCHTTDNEVFECCGNEAMEWTKPRKLSDVYEDIVLGPEIQDLINDGNLVQDVCFVEPNSSLSNLEMDSSGDFSNSSQDKAFGNESAVLDVVLQYEKLSKGRKTIIFNNSTKTNLLVYEEMKSKGYNVRLIDSVNQTEYSRKDVIKWFSESNDGVICNVATLVAGFDEPSCTSIILNMATTSLSKFIQCAGRGARTCNTIFKDSFLLIDLGGNIDRFNTLSSPRDWSKIFFDGIGDPKPRKETPLSVAECSECGFLFPRSQATCPDCGYTEPEKPKKEKIYSDSVLVPLKPAPLPNGHKIAKYAISRGEDKHFAFKVLHEQILDLFRFNLVSKEQYLSNKNDGRLLKRLGDIIRPVYFVLWDYTELVSPSNRTLKYVINKCVEKLDKYYGIQKDS